MNAKCDLKIGWATHEATKFACEKWHYSKSVPVPPLVKVGVWEDKKFIGVVVFSRGASSALLSPYGLDICQGCELTRIALTKHITPVSRIIKIALIFLKKTNPNLRLVISFADPAQNHVGSVYQGNGWIYTGKSNPSKSYLFKGKKLHSRQVSEKGWNIQQGMKRKTVKPSQCQVLLCDGKHRYLMPLDHEMKKQIEKLSKPYPKRAASIDNDALGYQPGEGGASPTAALHL